jgi:hypothetical protein
MFFVYRQDSGPRVRLGVVAARKNVTRGQEVALPATGKIAVLSVNPVLGRGLRTIIAIYRLISTIWVISPLISTLGSLTRYTGRRLPGGNATGFTIHEYAIGAKWLELLKQIAPTVTRVAVIRDPAIAAGTGMFGAIQSVASSFGVELNPVGVRDGGDIERAITAFARSSNGGLIVTGSVPASANRELIVALAARHRLPAPDAASAPAPVLQAESTTQSASSLSPRISSMVSNPSPSTF